MECVLGICTNDAVILAADASAGRSIMCYKQDAVKIWQLSQRAGVAVVGEGGDPTQFAEYITRNIHLHRLRQDRQLEVCEMANFTRKQLADFLRSQTPYQTNILLGGVDENEGPQLYWMDYLASMRRVPYALHGYSAHLALATLDKYYRPDLDRAATLQLLERTLSQLSRRFIIGHQRYTAVRITRDGWEQLPEIVIKCPDLQRDPAAAAVPNYAS